MSGLKAVLALAAGVTASITSVAVAATDLPAAQQCAPSVYTEIIAPAGKKAPPFPLKCSLSLKPGDVVNRRLLLEGASSSGATIDCNGAQIGGEDTQVPMIGIWSRQGGTESEPVWSRPTDITIRNCKIIGSFRTWGIGAGGVVPIQVEQSHYADAIERYQRAAPTRVQIIDSEIHTTGVIPIYVGPGTTAFTVTGTTFTGKAAIAIYLDHESADNRIEGNKFPISVSRELISVDGSARNVIADNEFGELGKRGGITLYRNCGERGVIRHQTPSDNRIYNNKFAKGAVIEKLIVENSRSGGRKRASFCDMDAGYPFGSSVNDDDLGKNNYIQSNEVIRE